MSLLIDALKKYRQESTPEIQTIEHAQPSSGSMTKAKKIVFISLIVIIIVGLTTIISFLSFKHIEKKRIVTALQAKENNVQQLKSLMSEKLQQQSAGVEKAGGVREALQQKLEQANSQGTAETATSATASEPTSTETGAAANTEAASSDVASSTPELRPRRLNNAERRGEFNYDEQQRRVKRRNTDAVDSTVPTASTSDASSASEDAADVASDDATASTSDVSSSTAVQPITIDVVPDEKGANNAIYQQALHFTQKKQYNRALTLLENNDDLLLKTDGLSALLLARIYLITGEYILANDALDRALMMRVGSETDLIELKAQALFMQHKYQETVDLLSSQSPDLSTAPEYYALLANAYMHLNQPKNASSVFEQIVARFPESANYWLGLAVAYHKMGDATSALVAYHRAAQLSSDDPQVVLFINQQIEALQPR